MPSSAPPPAQPPRYVIGDIHGQLEALVRLLQTAGLIDARQCWCGGHARLYLTGDFFDRGMDGVPAVALIMALQQEAAAAGGQVEALLGNHDVMVLSVLRLGTAAQTSWGETFAQVWLRNGGLPADLARLTPAQEAWLQARPALVRAGDLLLMHADSHFYGHLGATVEEVNRTVASVLASDDPAAWEVLLEALSTRYSFLSLQGGSPAEARKLLDRFHARRIVHGHTPISYITGRPPELVTEPYIYADGLCINVDGGLYLGGPGFVYSAPEAGEV
ncbi:metallophosphoesterase [Litorilinea aerophila]|uniref:Serine/threonine protein phosphatase n=1 Tax=Litorilinea aerophila TaxID=1204385 RepID=A0A540V9W0_9CHLR|nr:metallophosphoesterase [Litorilinea aerophila]MCC9078532.1 metallophosphoesterase [Litorilinea aerophila]GIV79950.1 MAG: serine/threonine protein phosphatase [Litorilinea sp.]